MAPSPTCPSTDELEWPIGPEGNEEGGMPAAGAAEETTSEVLTG